MATQSDESGTSRLGAAVDAVDRLGEWTIELVSNGEEDETTARAELVDGAEVLFIDSRAKAKELHEYDLAVLTADEYPKPAIIRCSAPIEIPEGASLVSAAAARIVEIGGKRVIIRPCSLVEPERLNEFGRQDRLEALPDTLDGATVPQTPVQNERFYEHICGESGQ